MITIFSSEELG